MYGGAPTPQLALGAAKQGPGGGGGGGGLHPPAACHEQRDFGQVALLLKASQGGGGGGGPGLTPVNPPDVQPSAGICDRLVVWK